MAANEPLTRNVDAFDRLVRQEEFILDVTETLTQSLLDSGVTKAGVGQASEAEPRLRVSGVRRGKKSDTENYLGYRGCIVPPTDAEVVFGTPICSCNRYSIPGRPQNRYV